MGTISAIKLSIGVSAYIQLPVGVHTIDDKIYTVEEKIENQGTDNEYHTSQIISIVPINQDNPSV